MLLAIDVGNTNTVFALHDGSDIVGEWRCRTERQRTADEYFVWLKELMEHAGLKPDVHSVVISSVVPQVVFNLRTCSPTGISTPARWWSASPRSTSARGRGSIRPPMSARTGW
jgi:pantothenate kinase type III